jgi:hypothetical protein
MAGDLLEKLNFQLIQHVLDVIRNPMTAMQARPQEGGAESLLG